MRTKTKLDLETGVHVDDWAESRRVAVPNSEVNADGRSVKIVTAKMTSATSIELELEINVRPRITYQSNGMIAVELEEQA